MWISPCFRLLYIRHFELASSYFEHSKRIAKLTQDTSIYNMSHFEFVIFEQLVRS